MMNVRRATVADGRLRVDFEGFRSWRDTFASSSSALPQRRSRNFVHAEMTLKRAIPILIVAFLTVVAASHFFGMMSEYGRMEAAARHSTALAAATAAAAFAESGQVFEAGDVAEAQSR